MDQQQQQNILTQYGDVPLDQAFPNAEVNPTVTQPEPTTTETSAPVTHEPFLSTSTGTVYKSAEEAARGIEHKDSVIARLRTEAIERTGIDPLTGQPVQRHETVQARKSYTEDGEKFITDLAEAAKSGDMKRYVKVQEQLVQDVIAPYAPMLSTFARNNAIETVAGKYNDYRTFHGSEAMKTTLSANPILARAIQFAEANPTQSTELGDLYEMAYRLNAARTIPEAVRQVNPVPQVRQTVTSTAVQAHPQGGRVIEQPNFATSEGRAALIEQQKRAGVMDIAF